VAKAKRVKGIDCRTSVADNARKIINVRLNEMLSFSEYVSDPAYVTELHDLRIAAKRLRYTLELFRFAFPGEISKLIDEVKEIQEHIGDMHDADVMIERITEVVESDAHQRMQRLLEIASAVDRGTVAQRHQRIRSAMTNRTTPRDEIALYTLIAHRADDRDSAYARFVTTWRRMEESEFPRRLRICVGLEAPNVEEPTVEQDSDGLEQVAG
jgi:hypothetical protein